MITDNQLKDIIKSLNSRYQKVDEDVLMKAARKAAGDAVENYKQLPEPKTRGLFSYVYFWVRAAIYFNENNDNIGALASKAEKEDPKYEKSSKVNIKAQEEYMLSFVPNAKWSDSEENIPDAETIWKSIESSLVLKTEKHVLQKYISLFDELMPKYKDLINGKAKAAKLLGFDSYLDRVLENKDKKAYKIFLRNKEKVAEYCKKQVSDIELSKEFYSQFNNKHFADFLTEQDIDIPVAVLEKTMVLYPILKEFSNKVKVQITDRESRAYYAKQTDSFDLVIDKNLSKNRQIIELTQQLSNIISDLKGFRANLNIKSNSEWMKERENNAEVIELKLLKEISTYLYKARMGQLLLDLVDIDFLVNAYQYPEQNLPKLYADKFNNYFPSANQEENFTYLIKPHLTFYPFQDLNKSISMVNALANEMSE